MSTTPEVIIGASELETNQPLDKEPLYDHANY